MSQPTLKLGGRPNTGSNNNDYVIANPVMSATLVDMGFSRYKSNRALQMVNNVSIDQAIQYIYDHFAELDQEEIMDTSSTTTTSTPVTTNPTPVVTTSSEPVNNQPSSILNSGGSIPVIYTNPNKLKGDSVEAKLAFAERERLKEQERIRKEKLEEKKRVKALKDAMKKEKEEKQARLSGSSSSASSSTASSSSTVTPKPSESSATSALIQVRLPRGSTEKIQLNTPGTLADLFKAVSSHLDSNEAYSILTPFPRKEYFEEDWQNTTLDQAGLVPKGSVILQLTKNKGVVIKSDTTMPTTTMPVDDGSDEEPTLPVTGGRTTGGHVLGGHTKPIDEEPALNAILKGNSNFNKEAYTLLLCEKQWILSKSESNEQTGTTVYRHLGDSNLGSSSLSECILYSSHGHVSMSNHGETMVGTWRFVEQHGGVHIELTYQNMAQNLIIESITNECLILKRSKN